jgi:quinol monooxygenase YgiN
MIKKFSFGTIIACLLILSASYMQALPSNSTNRMERIAKIKIDPKQLEAYHKALKEQMRAAIEKEPGVLSYYAVADKKDPASITIFEIYANEAAYKSHITSPHFLVYKEIVKNMVLSLDLQDVAVIASAKKPGM